MRLRFCCFTLPLLYCCLPAVYANEPMLCLDGYTPQPLIVAHADSIVDLAKAAAPAMMVGDEWLWVRRDDHERIFFEAGSPQRVRYGRRAPFWALLRPGKPEQPEYGPDGLRSSDIWNASVRPIPMFSEKPQHDGGAGDYARVLLSEDNYYVYEIGIDTILLGSGHWDEARRLYVLHGPDGRWQAIGEGPGEAEGRSGPVSAWTTSTVRVRLTGDSNAPVRIEFSITSGHGWSSEAPSPPYLQVEVHREAVLAGPLPEKLTWISAPFILAPSRGATFDAISNGYVFWELNAGSEELAKANRKQAEAFQKIFGEKNPTHTRGIIPPGTVLYLPSDDEIRATITERGK